MTDFIENFYADKTQFEPSEIDSQKSGGKECASDNFEKRFNRAPGSLLKFKICSGYEPNRNSRKTSFVAADSIKAHLLCERNSK